MAEPSDDLRRRVELLENQQAEHSRDQDRLAELLRDNVATSSRLSEILKEMKEEFKAMRSDMRDLKRLDTEIEKLKMGFGAVRWLALTVGGLATAAVFSYLFKFPVPT